MKYQVFLLYFPKNDQIGLLKSFGPFHYSLELKDRVNLKQEHAKAFILDNGIDDIVELDQWLELL